MSEFQVTLTEDERRLVSDILEHVLKSKRVEEHRTRTPSVRGIVVAEEQLIESVLGKLNHIAAA
ncbi:MAG: hypothetical protein IT424_11145 [Pirellulales bacterium]|nr:hypothetical protein [Pirellulales bacterium]